MTNPIESSEVCRAGDIQFSPEQLKAIQYHQVNKRETNPEITNQMKANYLGFIQGMVFGDHDLSPDQQPPSYKSSTVQAVDFETFARFTFVDEKMMPEGIDVSVLAFAKHELITSQATQFLDDEHKEKLWQTRLSSVGQANITSLLDDIYKRPGTFFDADHCEVLNNVDVFDKAKSCETTAHSLDQIFETVTLRRRQNHHLPDALIDAIAHGLKTKMSEQGRDIQLLSAEESKSKNAKLSNGLVTPSVDFYYTENGENHFVQISVIDVDPENGANTKNYKPPATSLAVNNWLLNNDATTISEPHILIFGMSAINDYIEIGHSIDVNPDEATRNYLKDTICFAIKNDSKSCYMSDVSIPQTVNKLLSDHKEVVEHALEACQQMKENYLHPDIKPTLLLPPPKMKLTEEDLAECNKCLATYAYNQRLLKSLNSKLGEVVKQISEIKPINDRKLNGKTCKSSSRTYNPKPEVVVKYFSEFGVDISIEDITHKINTETIGIDQKALQADIKASGLDIEVLKNVTHSMRIKSTSKEFKEVYEPLLDQMVNDTIAKVENNHVEALVHIESNYEKGQNLQLDATDNVEELGYGEEPGVRPMGV